MSKSFKVDMTGERHGRLVVLSFFPTNDKESMWLCKCDCGNLVNVRQASLKNGNTKSCGCIRRENNLNTWTKHGKRYTRLYHIWLSMKQRCFNPNNPKYKNYGGRGIIVCDEWQHDFQLFYDWSMKNGYRDDLTIDRIDNNGNYEPSNCRWADIKTQARNTRRNIIVKYNSNNITLPAAAEMSGIDYNILKQRYHSGDRGERLFRPVKK